MSVVAQNQARFSNIQAGMKDYEVEREAVRLANKQARNYNWPEEFWKAKIISDHWKDIRDEDGDLVAREIHLELYAVMNSGKCAMADFTFREKLHEDGKSTRVLFLYDHIGDMVNVACE
jgi:hypothetical protein